MRHWIFENLPHVLCGLILLARLGDIGSTYLVTPRMTLEGNVVARKFGWPYALLTLLVCLVPYYSPQLGVLVLVPSLLVSSSNVGKIWLVRTIGEQDYASLLLRLARSSHWSLAVGGVLGSAFFLFLTGATLWLLSPGPVWYWGYWFGLGIMLYATIIGLWGTLFYVRLFRNARRP
jgi:hypothetical protein